MNIAILLAGGTGSRMNSDIPKQYITVNNKMIFEYSLDSLMASECIHGIVIVADKAYQESIKTVIEDNYQNGKSVEFAMPGKTRQLSIYNGLKAELSAKSDLVFIHDAARPNLTVEMINSYIDACTGHDGILPVVPMKDTVYEVTDNIVTGLLDRSKLFAGQAPEIFSYKKYLEANERLLPDEIYKINGSSEPAIMYGMDILTVAGNENNYKITTDSDLEKFMAQCKLCD